MGVRLAHRGSDIRVVRPAPGIALGCVNDVRGEGRLDHSGRIVLAGDIAMYGTGGASGEASGDAPPGEQLARLVARDGPAAIGTINADFAAAIWDDETRRLWLARDFSGSRPLFLARLPHGGVIFASEYKALLAVDELEAVPALDMLQCLQHFKQLPSGRTLLANVGAVPPGSALLLFTSGDNRIDYRIPPLEVGVRYESEVAARDVIGKCFMRAIDRRLPVSGEIGVALSGGIDSIAIAYACRSLRPDAVVHAFTAGSGPADTEMLTAAYVAEQVGATHYPVILPPDAAMRRLPEIVWHLEDPIARSETAQFFEIGQTAGKVVDHLFTGVAADGLFAGMPKHKLLYLAGKLPVLRNSLSEFYTLTQSGKKPQSLAGRMMDKLYFRGSVPDVPDIVGSGFEPELTRFPEHGPEMLNQFLCGGLQEGLARWLPKVERTLRAGGLSFSSPFLDRELMQLAFAIPSALKIRRGREKYILRQALRSLVPEKVLDVPKFPMRMQHDLTFAEALDTLADTWLDRDRIEQRGFFTVADIDRLRRRSRSEPYGFEGGMRIWTAAATEIWAELFLDNRGAPPETVAPAVLTAASPNKTPQE
jgi:asparagine synthase (glutamine-hydrolysing)